MRTRLRLGALTLLASALAVGLALAACDAAGRLASAPPSAWGPTALTRALVLLACGAGALGAAWHALSGALAVIALAGPAPSARGAGIRRAALRALHRWGAPIMRRTTAGALVAAVAAGAPAMAAQAPGASDDLGWAPTASASAPAEPAPAPGPDASPGAEPAAPPPDPAAGAPSGETSAAEAPAGDPPAAEAPSAPATTHQVSAGESLWSITQELLDAGAAGAPTDPSSGGPSAQARVARAWPILYAANAESIGADPDIILPGTVLSVPEDLLRPPSRP
ncbi:peptidoglycan-binding protein LysM [Actinomyces dentalis]|uniref:peptidoglycan-binding protein LysM n=1 Tax=Actinomyces dentalis TaxID=272548 RepID=UPI0028E36F13|nr:peptidoglycan-binding protein LysM [Actinomyces dentalis]